MRMNVGDTATVGGYLFRFDGVSQVTGPNYVAARGEVSVSKNGEPLRTMYPEKRNYVSSGQTMTEADIATGFTRDLYVSLGEPVSGGAWSVSIFYKPFVDWIWGGAALWRLAACSPSATGATGAARANVAAREGRRGQVKATAPALASATTKNHDESLCPVLFLALAVFLFIGLTRDPRGSSPLPTNAPASLLKWEPHEFNQRDER